MLIAALLAFKLPFEIFLFSYAVLGPLHYLTEIGWLHQRSYFTQGNKDYFILVLACFIVFPIAYYIPEVQSLGVGTKAIFMAFISAAAMVIFKDWKWKLGFIGVALLSMVAINDLPSNFRLYFGAFLPTIIHVFVFTGAFILLGALKGRSWSGLLSFAVFILLAISFFYFDTDSASYVFSDYTRDAFIKSTFGNLSYDMGAYLGMFSTTDPTIMQEAFNNALSNGVLNVEDFQGGKQPSPDQVVSMLAFSKGGILLAKFFAYAYTYHYLNWFSKTKVISWHKIPRTWLIAIVLLWVASVALYLVDYKVGLVALFFLSMLHVFLEFPLNYRSFIGIGQESISIAKNGFSRPAGSNPKKMAAPKGKSNKKPAKKKR